MRIYVQLPASKPGRVFRIVWSLEPEQHCLCHIVGECNAGLIYPYAFGVNHTRYYNRNHTKLFLVQAAMRLL